MKKRLLPPALDPAHLADLARKAVLAAAKGEGTGHQRHAAAVTMLARKADEAMVWPATPIGLIVEAVDGLAARLLLGAIVRHAYTVLEREGLV